MRSASPQSTDVGDARWDFAFGASATDSFNKPVKIKRTVNSKRPKPLVLADLMRGTGRYNVARGMVATVQGVGASLSNTVAGLIVVWSGYDAAFLALSAVAFMVLTLLARYA